MVWGGFSGVDCGFLVLGARGDFCRPFLGGGWVILASCRSNLFSKSIKFWLLLLALGGDFGVGGWGDFLRPKFCFLCWGLTISF